MFKFYDISLYELRSLPRCRVSQGTAVHYTSEHAPARQVT